MPWNWELPHWPKFEFDLHPILKQERQFLVSTGSLSAYLKTIDLKETKRFIVEILTQEGIESSKIEGEILDRESLQSSIKQHFGIKTSSRLENNKESEMAKILCSVYDSFNEPLTHEMLYLWHSQLLSGATHIEDLGKYRTHIEPMQIVSNRYGSPKVYFEAPPSSKVYDEMTTFIHWFNSTNVSESILGKAAIAHVYFESIHPFEDGNGRIGRVLIEKILSQGIKRPVLIAVSKILEKRKKEYYASLEKCNRTLNISSWIEFFADIVLQAQAESMELLSFLIAKSKMFTRLSGQINDRQEKVLLKMFAAGPSGFKGGMSAEKYITITKTSRATATRDLNELIEFGALLKTGELRHTRYWLKLNYE